MKSLYKKGNKLDTSIYILKLSRQHDSIWSSWAISCINWFKYTVSGTGSVPILRQMMGMEPLPETLYLNQLMSLIAREDYIEDTSNYGPISF
jgi:hypothetical protein